jgi:uncharacterized protein
MKVRNHHASVESLSTSLGNSRNDTPFQKALGLIPFVKERAPYTPPARASGLSRITTDHGSVLLVDNPAAIVLKPEPVPHDWILSGNPEATATMLLRSPDWLQSIVVWECTPGRFNWHYNKDEVLFVISGHATLTSTNGDERDFGPGDTVFFPAGVSCTWLVRDTIRKVAILRETLFSPLGVFVRVWVKLLRTVGLAGKSPF